MERQRKQVTITLPPDILDWVDKEINNRTFANRSHAIEKALHELMKIKKKEEV
jgi:Arc/MetJ-type ribon-helix-helix transcriptional regulator